MRVAEQLRARGDAPRIVAVTNDPDSSLARVADLTLQTLRGRGDGAEHDDLRRGAGRDRRAPRWRSPACAPTRSPNGLQLDAEMTAAAIDDLLARSTLADDLVTWHGGRATTVILARGGARAAAEMGALTLKEAVGMPVESLQTAQFRHGPLELAGPQGSRPW